MFIIIVFRLGSDKLVSCFFNCLSPRDQSRDVTPRLGEGGWFFIFDCSTPFYFVFVNRISLRFFHLLYRTNMLCLLLLYLIMF